MKITTSLRLKPMTVTRAQFLVSKHENIKNVSELFDFLINNRLNYMMKQDPDLEAELVTFNPDNE